MTREERKRVVQEAYDAAWRRLDGTKDFLTLRDSSMEAIIAAAALLNRDPLALAELLTDGRLAEYIEAVEGTIPLSLDDPAPVHESMETLLQEAAEWVEKERDQLERKLSRSLKRFDRTAKDLRSRAQQIRSWKNEWSGVQSWVRWRESKGL